LIYGYGAMTQLTPFVLLFGGSGNRLFQLARAWGLQQAGLHPVVADIEEFTDLNWGANKLLGWTQHPIWIDTVALCKVLGLQRTRPNFLLRCRLYVSFLRLAFGDRRAQLNASMATDRRSVQIGYFQALHSVSPGSVSAVAEALRGLLDTAGPVAAQIVMHVRGGDFAVEDRLSAEVVLGFIAANPDCVCVTNDPEYVALYYPEVRVLPSTGPKADFTALSHARLIMPSNSTFCFWASVIAVRRQNAQLWFRPASDYWEQIEVRRTT
jgi:hypothetical protein